MRWVDIFRIASRMIQTNKLRAFLTILGIGIAVGLIVLLIDFGYGIQDMTIGSIVRSQNLLSLEITQSADGATPLTTDQLTKISQTEGISKVSPVLTTSGELHLKDTVGAATVTAVDPDYFAMQGVTIQDGRFFENGTKELVVSPELLGLLDIPAAQALGQTVRLSYSDPRYDSTSTSIDDATIVGVSDKEDVPTIYMPFSNISSAESLKLTSVEAVAENQAGVIQAQNELVHNGYQVETLYETLAQARSIFRWVTIGLVAFGLIAMIVASIGMFNTLTIALLERTREFGIMKAIGVTDRTIRRLFLTEAGLIGMLGGLAGVGIALFLETIIQTFLNHIVANYGGEHVTLFARPSWFLLSMVAFPLLLGLITGLYPAIRAAKLNPLKALRYE